MRISNNTPNSKSSSTSNRNALQIKITSYFVFRRFFFCIGEQEPTPYTTQKTDWATNKPKKEEKPPKFDVKKSRLTTLVFSSLVSFSWSLIFLSSGCFRVVCLSVFCFCCCKKMCCESEFEYKVSDFFVSNLAQTFHIYIVEGLFLVQIIHIKFIWMVFSLLAE